MLLSQVSGQPSSSGSTSTEQRTSTAFPSSTGLTAAAALSQLNLQTPVLHNPFGGQTSLLPQTLLIQQLVGPSTQSYDNFWSTEEHTRFLAGLGSSVLPDVHDLFLRVGTRTLQQVERHLALYLIALQKSPNQKQLNLNDMYAALGMSGSWLDHQIRAQLAKTSPSAQAPKSQSVNNLIDLQSVLQLQHQQQSLQSNPAAAIALLPALQGALAGQAPLQQLQQLKQQIQQQQQLQQILQLQQQLEQIQQLQSAQSQAKPTPPSSQTKVPTSSASSSLQTSKPVTSKPPPPHMQLGGQSKTPAAPGQQKVATSSAMSILHLTSQNQPSKTTAGSNLSKSTTSAASAISSHPLGQASKGLSSFQQQSQQKVPGSSQHIKYPIPSQHPSASGGGQDKKLQNALGMKHTAAGIVIDDSQSFSDQFKKRGRDESLVLTDDGLLTSAAFMQRSKVGNEKNAKKPKSRDSPSQHSPVLATAPKLWANIKSEHDVQAANKNPMSMDFLLDGSCNANVKNSNGSKERDVFDFRNKSSSHSSPIQSKETAASKKSYESAMAKDDGRDEKGKPSDKKLPMPKKKYPKSKNPEDRKEESNSRCPSPSVDRATQVEVGEIREQVEEMLRVRSAEGVAHSQELSEWEWVRKRLIGNSSRGSAAYSPWWSIFMDTVPLGKRHVNEDIRTINKSAPPPKNPKDASFCKKDKSWLQKGKPVEVKWDGEWWQAKIKSIKYERGSDKPEKVFVSYVGGTVDEDEWIPLSGRRVRPPTEAFEDTTRGH